MSTLSRLALGAMGRLRTRPARGPSATSIVLPPAVQHGGLPLMDALSQRRSAREFAPQPLPLPMMSSLLWAAWGINRPDGHRTAPTAMDCREIDLYVALPEGAYLYDPIAHALHLAAARDVRRVTGYQDFVDEAPLDLVYVYDTARMRLVPRDRREGYAAVAAGAIPERVPLRRERRAGHGAARVDRPRRPPRCARAASCPAGAALSNRRLPPGSNPVVKS